MIDFSVEPAKTAFMIIDMQNVFVEGSPSLHLKVLRCSSA